MAGGISRTISDERGAVMVLMAAVCFILTLLFMGTCEFGRWLIVKEQAQTAADAAAHAAMLSGAERMVRLRIYTVPGTTWLDPCGCICCGKDDCDCCACCVLCSNEITVTGTMRFLLDQGGWYSYKGQVCGECPGCFCDINYEILDHWVRFDKSTSRDAARGFFQANFPDQAKDAGLARNDVKVYGRDSQYGPSVVVYAWYKVASLFPGAFGIFPEDAYGGKVCSQADVFYRDPEGSRYIADKYRRSAPRDACWKELP
ncbi:MAG: TadE/TadG family type IV pilus assembly protein [Desulfotomaculales bacterium]